MQMIPRTGDINDVFISFEISKGYDYTFLTSFVLVLV